MIESRYLALPMSLALEKARRQGCDPIEVKPYVPPKQVPDLLSGRWRVARAISTGPALELVVVEETVLQEEKTNGL